MSRDMIALMNHCQPAIPKFDDMEEFARLLEKERAALIRQKFRQGLVSAIIEIMHCEDMPV